MCTSIRLEWRERESSGLRDEVFERLRSGRLPRGPASTVRGLRSPGAQACDACGAPVAAGEIHYRAEFDSEEEGRQRFNRVIALHPECYTIWDQESNG